MLCTGRNVASRARHLPAFRDVPPVSKKSAVVLMRSTPSTSTQILWIVRSSCRQGRAAAAAAWHEHFIPLQRVP